MRLNARIKRGWNRFKWLARKGLDIGRRAVEAYDKHKHLVPQVTGAMRDLGGEKTKRLADRIDRGAQKAEAVRKIAGVITG